MSACRLQGKIFFQLQEYAKSEQTYRAALQAQPTQMAAWKGLAELHNATKNATEAAAAHESLVSQ